MVRADRKRGDNVLARPSRGFLLSVSIVRYLHVAVFLNGWDFARITAIEHAMRPTIGSLGDTPFPIGVDLSTSIGCLRIVLARRRPICA